MPEWAPSVEDVAALLRARTYVDGGEDGSAGASLEGTFTAETRPTTAQVELLIADACAEVESVFASGVVPAPSAIGARRTAALKAAYFVELSYFPEQDEEGQSPYLQLRAQAESSMTSLIAASQMRDMFAEGAADGSSS